jgi:hypothetical protein
VKQLKILFSPQATKAWLAAFGALVSALVMGNQDHVIDSTDWLTAIDAFVITLTAVFSIPNAKSKDAADD